MELTLTMILTDDQSMLAGVTRAFLEEHAPSAAARRDFGSERGFDRDMWTELTATMGLAGILVPAASGGAGSSVLDLAVVFEELGAALVPCPLLGSAALAAAGLAALPDTSATRELLARIATGEAITSIAVLDSNGQVDLCGHEVVGQSDGERVRLTGTRRLVPFGRSHDVILVPAMLSGAVRLCAVHPSAPGVRFHEVASLDPASRLADLSLDAAEAVPLNDVDGLPAIEHAFRVATVCLASEHVGIMRTSLDMTVRYVRDRVQFGRPVGSFGAVKGGCAEMYVELELASTVVRAAASAIDMKAPDAAELTAIAAYHTGRAVRDVTAGAIHFHGGIGYTWEHDAHLMYRRARTTAGLLGTIGYQREALAKLLDLGS